MNEILEMYYKSLPVIDALFDGEASIYLCDNEKFIYCKEGRDAKNNYKEGKAIPTDGIIARTFREKKNVVEVIDNNIWGIKIKVYSIAIKDNGSMCGALIVVKSLSDQEALNKVTDNLMSSIRDISKGVSEITSGVEDLVNMNSELLSESNAANENAKDTDGIVSLIQGIASQTNLLGLNASIEASRAGEYGKGFAVVAQEIRKLSNSSKESINKIDSVIKQIRNSMNGINTNLNKSNEVSQKQAVAVQDITKAIESLNETAKILENLTSRL